MPETPRRRSRVLSKLINPARTKQAHEKKGLVLSKHVVTKELLGNKQHK